MNIGILALASSAVLAMTFAGAQAGTTSPSSDTALPTVKALTMMASSVPCSDLDRSINFYTKGLGMTLGGRVEMGSVIEAPLMFPGGGAYILLQHPKAEGTALPARGMLNRIGLMVPDLEALKAQLNAAGYGADMRINNMPQYHVSVAIIQDPDGNSLELIQRGQ